MYPAEHFQLPPRYHQPLVAWQKKNFPDYALLQKYWAKHFPGSPCTELCVKLAPLKSSKIEVGRYYGHDKLAHASEMKGNMLYSALRIIKAQCSTELGSIQQHAGSVDAIENDYHRFSVLRIMAEELRHAYQMFWVLSHDASWSEGGIKNLGDATLDELLAMHTGTHVLDAFNIPFSDPLDNIVFAVFIDRVGRHHLSMQKVFAYAPMARSMEPMLDEEHFHLTTGMSQLCEVVRLGAQGKGNWSLAEIQRRLNAWYPRGLEMFGNPEAGETNIAFGFKNQMNRTSSHAYMQELMLVMQRLNKIIASELNIQYAAHDEDAPQAPAAPFLHLPHEWFFRMRSPVPAAYQPIDVSGQRLGVTEFFRHLQDVLPSCMLGTGFFMHYQQQFAQTHGIGTPL